MAALVRCIFIIITIINAHIIRALENEDPKIIPTIADSPVETQTSSEEAITETPFPSLTAWDYDVHCKLQSNSYDCMPSSTKHPQVRWYYDIKMQDCKKFNYYRCYTPNRNIFKTDTDCMRSCRELGPHDILDVLPENAACMMQPDEGDCQEYVPMYYYDISARRCLGFGFSGCGGNQNRFHDEKTCQKVCVTATSAYYNVISDKRNY